MKCSGYQGEAMPARQEVVRRSPQAKAVPFGCQMNLNQREVIFMLRLAVVFLVIALIAALFNFIGVAGTAIEIAKILFFVFIVLAILSFLVGGFRTPPA